MKKLLLALTVIISSHMYAQAIDPVHQMHQAIKHLFKAKYTEAKHVHFHYLDNGFTEADFVQNESEMTVFYDNTGALVETDLEVRWLDVPRQARYFVYENYEGCKIRHIIEVKNKNDDFYKVVIEDKGVTYKYKFSKDGNIIGGYELGQ
jgi:hypothetical protein